MMKEARRWDKRHRDGKRVSVWFGKYKGKSKRKEEGQNWNKRRKVKAHGKERTLHSLLLFSLPRYSLAFLIYTSQIYVLNFLLKLCLASKSISEEHKCKLKLKLGHLMLRDLSDILIWSSVILVCLENHKTYILMSMYSNENFNLSFSWRMQVVPNHFLFQKITLVVIVEKASRHVVHLQSSKRVQMVLVLMEKLNIE